MIAIEPLEEHLRDHPLDWSSWLAYADWLREQGDARGDLVRLEHRRAVEGSVTAGSPGGGPVTAGSPGGGPVTTGSPGGGSVTTGSPGGGPVTAGSPGGGPGAPAAPAAQIEALTREHAQSPWPGLPEKARLAWRNGFVVGLDLPLEEEAAGQLETILASRHARFLTSLHLIEGSKPEGGDDFADEVEPSMRPAPLAPPQASAMAAILALDLGRIRSVSFAYLSIGAEGARALASSRLGPLDALDLRYAWIGDDGVAALAAAPRLSRLTSLSLQRNDITAKGARALAGSLHLGALRRLDLRYNPLKAQGAQALAASPVLAGLEGLKLYHADIGKAGGRALAESPHLPTTLTRFWRALSPRAPLSGAQ